MRVRNNGQINVVLKNGHSKKLEKPLISAPMTTREIPSHHIALKEIEEELNQLVGMEEMKRVIKEIYAWIYVNKQREAVGLKAQKQALHMMFKGNPGTGKTTVARLIGKLFVKMNVLAVPNVLVPARSMQLLAQVN